MQLFAIKDAVAFIKMKNDDRSFQYWSINDYYKLA